MFMQPHRHVHTALFVGKGNWSYPGVVGFSLSVARVRRAGCNLSTACPRLTFCRAMIRYILICKLTSRPKAQNMAWILFCLVDRSKRWWLVLSWGCTLMPDKVDDFPWLVSIVIDKNLACRNSLALQWDRPTRKLGHSNLKERLICLCGKTRGEIRVLVFWSFFLRGNQTSPLEKSTGVSL